MRKKIIFWTKFWKELRLKEKIMIATGIIAGLFFLILPAWYFWDNNFEKLPAEGGVLKEGLYQPINTLNPFLATNSSEKSLINLLFDKLVVDNGKGGFYYELAKNTTELGRGLKFLVELRDDRLWNNQEKITSDDLIYSFENLKRYGSDDVRNLFKDIEVEKLDNFQVFFKLKIRDNYFYNKLNQIYIIPKSVWQKFNQSDWQAQEEEILKIISGPYQLEQKTDNEIIFVENKFYLPRPFVKKLIFKIYPDLQSTIEGLRIREIDAIGGVPSNILKSVSSRRFEIKRITLPRIIGVFFNSKEVSNIDAITLSSLIDREKINQEIFDNEAEISYGVFSQSIRKMLKLSDNNQNTEQIQQDQKLNIPPIEIIVPQNYFFQKIADFLSEKIPLKLRVESTENIYSDILQNKTYQAIILGINYNLPPNLSPFFFEGSSFNLINKSTQDLTKFLQKLAIEQLDQKSYSETLEKVEKEILLTNKAVFIANPYYIYVLPKKLKGYELDILRQPEERFAKIELWHFKTRTKWR